MILLTIDRKKERKKERQKEGRRDLPGGFTDDFLLLAALLLSVVAQLILLRADVEKMSTLKRNSL